MASDKTDDLMAVFPVVDYLGYPQGYYGQGYPPPPGHYAGAYAPSPGGQFASMQSYPGKTYKTTRQWFIFSLAACGSHI